MNESEVKKLPSKITNRPNNFNETFQSSILTKGQKFMFDKTLVQGIKENDSSKIVQNSEEADLGQANELYDQQKQVNEIFVNTRKKFDHTKETSVRLENNIERLKKEKQIVLAQKTKIQMTFSEQQKEFKRVQQALENLNHLCEAAQYDKDIRLQMVQVLKRDILLYKKNSFDANTKIFRNHSRIKTLYGRFESTKKVSNNCRSLIYSIEKKITEKQTKRFDKLNSYHEIINRKVQNNIKRQERQKMIEVSMLEALNGKMPEEQQQKKLLIANLVLKRMLKLKMERQMQRFNEIETTFRKIKQNTTVKRADEFVQKFIKREKNYGELLESISKNQQKIIKLKQQKQYLEKQNNELLYAKQQIEDKQNEKKSMIKKQMHASIDMLRQKLLNNEFLKNKTFSFVTKFISAFDENNIQIVKGKLSREEPQKSLKQALMRINKFIDSLEREKSEERLKQIYIESKNLNIPENIKSKNMRIKTITAGEQNQDSAIQNYDAAYDDASQQEFLNQNRKQIKKSTYLRNRIKTRAF